MSAGISRDEAWNLLNEYIKQPNMVSHSLAAEVVMEALADYFGEDRNKWGIAGLLHDLDVEITNADLGVHGQETVKILNDKGIAPDVVEAIELHNEAACGRKRSERFHYALAAGETITGLITATTLVYPDKKIVSVKPKSIVKRMKEKAFAASVNRDIIRECELIGIPLNQFAEICLKAMRTIGPQIGL